ncbi:MAG: hypothetical protein ACUVYA_18355 [Planctomycetota bacterium]
MRPLEIHIRPQDSLAEACLKVRNAYREAGATVLAFEHLNTLLSTSSFCHFLHVELEGKVYIAVVSTKEWDDRNTLAVLNILLNLRMDPEPPGSWPLFRFYGAHPVSPVLVTLFGDEAPSAFECRAALVVGYGADVRPAQSYQLATVAVRLLRECLGLKTSLLDPRADEVVAEALSRWFRPDRFPEGGAPINSLVVLGFLYGESLRARLPYASRWVRLKDAPPWPVLVFGGGPEGGRAPGPGRSSSPGRVSCGDRSHVVFSPVSTVISAYQENAPKLLREASSSLEAKCEEVLGAFDEL